MEVLWWILPTRVADSGDSSAFKLKANEVHSL
jgi:hypothetical protein